MESYSVRSLQALIAMSYTILWVEIKHSLSFSHSPIIIWNFGLKSQFNQCTNLIHTPVQATVLSDLFQIYEWSAFNAKRTNK